MSTGTTSGLSTSSSRFWPGFRSAVRNEVAVEGEPVLVGIFIRPVPLMPGDLDRHVRVRHPVHVIHQLEGRDGDNDQDQHWHDGPQHLDDRVVRGTRRHRVARVVEANHDVEQQAQHEQRDQRDDDQQLVVKRRQTVLDRRGGRLHAELPRPRPFGPRDRTNDGATDHTPARVASNALAAIFICQ